MSSPKFDLVPATEADTYEMGKCFAAAFTHQPEHQAPFFAYLFPDCEGLYKWFDGSLKEQMRREPNSLFLKAVDKATGRMVGWVKWAAPDAEKAFYTAYPPEIPKEFADQFFAMMATNRTELTGGRRHWYLEVLGVVPDYGRSGVGSAMVDAGCQLADRDGLECYVDSSPAARPLYEKYGFVAGNTHRMQAPYDYYVETFLVRPAKGAQ